MQTGFEIMDYDRNLKNMWIRRIVASIIDSTITFFIALLAAYYLWPNMLSFDLIIAFFLQGLLWYIYSIPFDILWGKTPGKMVMKIKAVSFVGNLNTKQALLRNLTKLNIILVIGDAIAGLSTEGDPRQRYTERFIDSITVMEKRWGKKAKKLELSKGEKKKEEEELVLPE